MAVVTGTGDGLPHPRLRAVYLYKRTFRGEGVGWDYAAAHGLSV